jgi:membrane dipeptidase
LNTKIVILALLIISVSCTPKPKSIEETAMLIHEKVLTVDSHTDSPWYLLQGGFDMDERHDVASGGSQLDFPRMKEGDLDAVFMAAFVGQRERNDEGNRKAKEKVMATIDSIHTHLAARTATAMLALVPADAYNYEKEGKRSVFIGIENGYAIGNDIGNVELFFQLGARYITLCHSRNNDICDSSNDSTEHNGLSDFGIEVVKEMNRTGMMIDVSHISDSAFYDVIALSTVPVIASHSCARALCDTPRNLNDDMLKLLAKNGGVIQLCILSDYVKLPEPYPERDSAFQATIADAVDHIDHIVEIAGIDHVGIGTDFDGGGGLADCKDVSELGGITLELVRRGYSEEDIRKIWGANIMRVMGEVLKARQTGLPG